MKGTFKFDPKHPTYFELTPEGWEGIITIDTTFDEDNLCYDFQIYLLNGYKLEDGSSVLCWYGDYEEVLKIITQRWKAGEITKENK
ncbi:hypothetical protein VP424E501_P0298 [Vibrio phage 424E50-1]|nr:hypothetical protein VP424E501_P0298 [Vibrio phage 424E50-1]